MKRLTYRGLENIRRRCPWNGCGRKSHQTGRLCSYHRYRNLTYGSPDRVNISRARYSKLVPAALEWITTTKKQQGTQDALAALAQALDPQHIPTSDRLHRLHDALAHLHTTSRGRHGHRERITTEDLLAESLALCAWFRSNPGYSSKGFWLMMCRAWLRMRPKSIYRSTINPNPPYKQEATRLQFLPIAALEHLARRVSEPLRLFMLSYYDVLKARADRDERLRLAAQGFASVDEEFEAKLTEARQRAEKLNPKKSASTHVLDNIPKEFTPDERRQYVAAVIKSATETLRA